MYPNACKSVGIFVSLYSQKRFMIYLGSKNRIAKHILPIMLEDALANHITTWVEPFVGGGNLIDKVPDTFNRVGMDINQGTISALISIRDFITDLPKTNKEFTEADYKALKTSNNYPHQGYAGFALSFGGKWLGGYRKDKVGYRDYVNEAYLNSIKQSPLLQGVELKVGSYEQCGDYKNALIYCDPPYQGTTSYNTGTFDHNKFWQWCREMSKDNLVYISEYNAPEDFECVWEGQISTNFDSNRVKGSKKATEKLFKFKHVQR